MRLIDADSLIRKLQESKLYTSGRDWQQQIQQTDALINLLEAAPTIATCEYNLWFIDGIDDEGGV